LSLEINDHPIKGYGAAMEAVGEFRVDNDKPIADHIMQFNVDP